MSSVINGGSLMSRTQSAAARAERVKVFCRVRPLLQREREGWSYDEYTPHHGEDEDGNSNNPPDQPPSARDSTPSSVFLTEKGKIPLDSSVLSINSDGKSLAHSGSGGSEFSSESRKDFTFDASLREDSAQDDVYQRVAYDIVQDVLDGYNGTILAYGQTSTGKTYTMLGKDNALVGDHRGIIPRAFEDIFDRAEKTRQQAKTTVALSYVQIYCERVFDLLNPETPHASLMIREDTERGGVYLDGAAIVPVSSVEDCMRLITRGNANRAVASTGMNAHSSRSHAVLIARIERKEYPSASTSSSSTSPPTQMLKLSNLYLVDLAGSERVKKAKVYGRHVSELKAINLSLSALGNCISALSKQQPQRHIPYRDSKLTRLLSSSLGGNAKTSLIITVSPSPTESSETLSTLQFGQRAMKVVVQAHQNVLSVLDYKALYEDTQQRLDESRSCYQQLQTEMDSQVTATRAAEDQLVKAQLRIQHLEFECKAAKVQASSGGSTNQSGGSSSRDPEIDAAALEQHIAVLVKQRDQDIARIKEKCDHQVETYKRLAEEAQQEWHELEDELAKEKQQVLASLLELKDFKMRFFDLEDTSTDRIAELVSEEGEKERERIYEKELLQQRLKTHEKTIQELQQKLAKMEQHELQLQEQIEVDYVPKEAIKQMETLYETAISKLQARVGSLEQRSTSSRKLLTPNNNQEADVGGAPKSSRGTAPAKAPLPTVAAPPGGKAIPKIGRIVPGSRANSSLR